MKTLTVLFGVLVGIVILGAFAVGGYFAIKFGLDLFGTLDPQVATMTAIASLVALLSASIIAGGFKWAGRREKELQVRAEKADLYERLVLMWGARLHQQDRAVDQAAEAELLKLVWLLTLRGSPKVIKAVGALQAVEQEAGAQSQAVHAQLAKLLLEMRLDLGRVGMEPSERDLLDLLQADAPRAGLAVPVSPAVPQVSLSRGT
jgi:hypothetical protein